MGPIYYGVLEDVDRNVHSLWFPLSHLIHKIVAVIVLVIVNYFTEAQVLQPFEVLFIKCYLATLLFTSTDCQLRVEYNQSSQCSGEHASL